MFYHYILNEDKNSLIHKFYKIQFDKAAKNDWCLTVKENLETLRINNTEEQIQKLSEESFKILVNSAIKKEAFNYLKALKNSHTKVLHIEYEKLKMQKYLAPCIFSCGGKIHFLM